MLEIGVASVTNCGFQFIIKGYAIDFKGTGDTKAPVRLKKEMETAAVL